MIQFSSPRQSHPIQASQVTWPNDNKAVGNCFHALIAGLRPASFDSGAADRVPAGFAWCWTGADTTLRGSRAGPGRPPAASTPRAIQHTATLAAQRQGARRRGNRSQAAYFPRARKSTTRRAGLGRPRAASTTARFSHSATLLPNGMVLVAGGIGSLNPHSGPPTSSYRKRGTV